MSYDFKCPLKLQTQFAGSPKEETTTRQFEPKEVLVLLKD
jgi:hypothetical protein